MLSRPPLSPWGSRGGGWLTLAPDESNVGHVEHRNCCLFLASRCLWNHRDLERCGYREGVGSPLPFQFSVALTGCQKLPHGLRDSV